MQEKQPIQPKEAKMGDEKKGRVGETSHSPHEMALEHHRNAMDLSMKSHITKHWMNAPGDSNTQSSFTIGIVKRYAD